MVTQRFHGLLQRVQLTAHDRLLFAKHQSSIRSRLNKSFATNQVRSIGSVSRGSAIHNVSDVDLLVVLRVAEVRWGDYWKSSATVLKNIRDELQDRYTHTEVGRDGQAVVTDFGDGTHPVDVVPGVYLRPGISNYPVFAIPDGEGAWLQTSPEAHNRYIVDADAKSGGKLKNVACLVKFWATCRAPAVPISGFHVELLLATSGACTGVKTYAQCLYETFRLLHNRGTRAIQDPLGFGYIPAANTQSKRDALNSALSFAHTHALAATTAELSGDALEAVRQWDIVFNGKFPAV